jgi:hypothetical protein
VQARAVRRLGELVEEIPEERGEHKEIKAGMPLLLFLLVRLRPMLPGCPKIK